MVLKFSTKELSGAGLGGEWQPEPHPGLKGGICVMLKDIGEKKAPLLNKDYFQDSAPNR